MDSATFCVMLIAALAGDTVSEQSVDQQRACERVIEAAYEHGVCPYLLASVAWHESRFSESAVSSCGAYGPLQVLPRYHCPGRVLEGCDTVDAGAQLIARLLGRYGDVSDVLCHYNAGTVCDDSSYHYADRVSDTVELLHEHVDGADCGC
jgi:soluble lytic murein transglycosylase-like protein